MLDYDLAAMYGVKTKALNQAVKRNIERFPEDFMFQLTKGEWEILKCQIGTSRDWKSQNVISNLSENHGEESLRSQIVTANNADNQEETVLRSQIVTSKQEEKRGGTQYCPYAFTEHGALMLASVLRSPIAIETSIIVTRAFVAMRHTLSAISLPAKVSELERNIENLRQEMNDILADQNDINETTRAQLDAISTALAELQPKDTKPRRKIGFV